MTWCLPMAISTNYGYTPVLFLSQFVLHVFVATGPFCVSKVLSASSGVLHFLFCLHSDVPLGPLNLLPFPPHHDHVPYTYLNVWRLIIITIVILSCWFNPCTTWAICLPLLWLVSTIGCCGPHSQERCDFSDSLNFIYHLLKLHGI